MNESMIVGIDPAPKKKSTVFDGTEYFAFSAKELAKYLSDLKKTKDITVLIAWDAPLTGPHNPESQEWGESDFTQRDIEKFFSREGTGFKAPEGISVRPYSGCPHWAISRALVGLPRVGPWDAAQNDLPFSLLTEDLPPKGPGHFIVEVHPAVAAWLWCKDHADAPREGEPWEYKKDKRILDMMWAIIREKIRGRIPAVESGLKPKNDDQFDALLAYALGVLWMERKGEVCLLGDHSTGALLVPNVEGLLDKFHDRSIQDRMMV